MFQNKKTILLLTSTITLAVLAIIAAWVIYQRTLEETTVAPTAPASQPAAAQCITSETFALNTSGTTQPPAGGAPLTLSPTPTSTVSTTPTPTSNPTPTTTIGGGNNPTSTPTTTNKSTAVPTKASTSSAAPLPVAGFNLPSILFLGSGAFVVMLGILLLAL